MRGNRTRAAKIGQNMASSCFELANEPQDELAKVFKSGLLARAFTLTLWDIKSVRFGCHD
jgi:hypothetical protein